MSSSRSASSDAPSAALALIGAHTVMSLATLVDGAPHAVSLMYAHDGYTLYWVSDPNSRHSVALKDNRVAAVTIAGQITDFQTIIGLQMLGRGREIVDPGEAKEGLRLLRSRYDFIERFFVSGPLELARRFRLASVYRFDPDEITLIDNSQGFGHKNVFRPGRS